MMAMPVNRGLERQLLLYFSAIPGDRKRCISMWTGSSSDRATVPNWAGVEYRLGTRRLS